MKRAARADSLQSSWVWNGFAEQVGCDTLCEHEKTVLGRAKQDFRPPFLMEGERKLQKLFDHFNPRMDRTRVETGGRLASLSLLCCMVGGASLFGACSKGDSAQGEWPDPSFVDPTQSEGPQGTPTGEPSPDKSDSTSEPDPSDNGEPDSSNTEPGASSADPEQSTSGSSSTGPTGETSTDKGTQDSKSDDSTGELTSSPGQNTSSKESSSTSQETTSSSSTSSETQETESSSDQSSEGDTNTGDSDPSACELELCVRMNDEETPNGSSWRVGMNMFSFKVPKTHRRLARIELNEGFISGKTLATLRRDAGTSSAGVIEKLEWLVNLPTSREWRGATLTEPVSIEGVGKLWVVLDNNRFPSRASIAITGDLHSIWHKASGSKSWTESGVPLMFRAYCCKE